MAKGYFQFKQFIVRQDQCAMKVSTDACVLGAYVAYQAAKPNRILDIGSGTGLLSLMLAQEFNVPIDAVELDEDAFGQSQANFEESPWANRLRAYHQPIQEFVVESTKPYDLIISNPPFFPNHYKNENAKRSQARHTDTLSFEDLIQSVLTLLSNDGTFYLLLSSQQDALFESLAAACGLFCQKKLMIRDREGTPIIRVVSEYGKQKQEQQVEELITRVENRAYSTAFANLLRAYYLIF